MVITVKALGTKVLETHYNDLLVAPIDRYDPLTKQLHIGELVVDVRSAITFSPNWNSGQPLPPSTSVRVSGYQVSANKIVATLVVTDKTMQRNGIEIDGTISDVSNGYFKLYGMGVYYNPTEFSPAQLYVGRRVEVQGSLEAGEITASTIKFIEPEFKQDDHLVQEGFVSQFNASKNSLTLNEVDKALLNSNTWYDFSEAEKGLKVGMLLTVEGIWDAKLKALKSTVIERDSIGVEGIVTDHEHDRITLKTSDSHAYYFGISGTTTMPDSLLYQRVNVLGYIDSELNVANVIEPKLQGAQIVLEGMVENKHSLWGYTASDDSLVAFSGESVKVSCDLLAGAEILNCKAG